MQTGFGDSANIPRIIFSAQTHLPKRFELINENRPRASSEHNGTTTASILPAHKTNFFKQQNHAHASSFSLQPARHMRSFDGILEQIIASSVNEFRPLFLATRSDLLFVTLRRERPREKHGPPQTPVDFK